jgi:tetratricopeptide (TPR) repeat protein
MDAPKNWSAARERTHDEQIITELHLPEELVDEPFYLIHFAAGYSYYIQKKYEEALPHFKAALGRKGAIPRELADLQSFTGLCHFSLDREGVADLQEAIGLFEKAARAYEKVDQKKWAATQIYLGDAYKTLSTGDRDANKQKAIVHYDEVIRLDPKDAGAYIQRGFAYQGKGDYNKAITDCDEAIRLDPKNACVYIQRGFVYQGKGDYDKAITDYDEAIRLDPKNAGAYYCNRGDAYYYKGRYDKAIADYHEAIRLDPKYENAYNELAWVLGTCIQASFRNGKKAIEYATKSYELTNWKRPSRMDTLAAAYAEVGDFEHAIEWEMKYLETLNSSDERAADAKSRLALYQAHKPYHAE